MSEIAAGVLLAIGVLGFAFTSAGLLLARNVFDQIHYLAPGSLIGSVAISAAVDRGQVFFHVGDNYFSRLTGTRILGGCCHITRSPALRYRAS